MKTALQAIEWFEVGDRWVLIPAVFALLGWISYYLYHPLWLFITALN